MTKPVKADTAKWALQNPVTGFSSEEEALRLLQIFHEKKEKKNTTSALFSNIAEEIAGEFEEHGLSSEDKAAKGIIVTKKPWALQKIQR